MSNITVNDLSFAYDRAEVLKNVNCTAESGCITALLGANGAGKSTLFKCILGLCNGYKGKILCGDTDISTLNQRQKAKIIAYIPQSHHPVFSYSVFDMVMMGTAHRVSTLSSPNTSEIEMTNAALDKIGISHLAHRGFLQLSGGEQQLVLIARALVQNTKILLMDEPTSSLDYGNQLRVLERTRELKNEGYTILMSSHNPQHVLTYSDRVIAIKDGKVIAQGNTSEILNKELIKNLYNIDVEFIETPYGKALVPIANRSEYGV